MRCYSILKELLRGASECHLLDTYSVPGSNSIPFNPHKKPGKQVSFMPFLSRASGIKQESRFANKWVSPDPVPNLSDSAVVPLQCCFLVSVRRHCNNQRPGSVVYYVHWCWNSGHRLQDGVCCYFLLPPVSFPFSSRKSYAHVVPQTILPFSFSSGKRTCIYYACRETWVLEEKPTTGTYVH